MWTNASSASFAPRGGAITVTNEGRLVTVMLSVDGNGQIIRVAGGSVVVTGDKFRVLVNVSGTLVLPTNATVRVSAAGGAVPADMPNPAVLFTYGSAGGASTLNGWTVTGLQKDARILLDTANQRVLMDIPRGTVISVR